MTTITPLPVSTATPKLEIEAWRDAVVESVGHDPRSDYAQDFWLPILGPSAMAVSRKLIEHLDRHGDGEALDLAELALSVGLASPRGTIPVGRSSRIVSTLDRLERFGFARRQARPGTDLYCVRVAWPPLTRRQAERLPLPLLVRLQAA